MVNISDSGIQVQGILDIPQTLEKCIIEYHYFVKYVPA